MRCVIRQPGLTIYEGEADQWPGSETIDFVMTNPYGYLPRALATTPMVIHQWAHRHAAAEAWTYSPLTHCVGLWNDGRETFWSAHCPPRTIDVSEFHPEPGGWYPEELVRRILSVHAQPGQTIWDGFMGRGTVAKVARELGMSYVGVERLPHHITLAREYLSV